jgi:Asp-tRNA(Asn)/Glu-tRNA(Gln) amidotransferase A subunit family amidase
MVAAINLPLLSLANALRSGQLSIAAYLDGLEERFSEREGTVQAFLPEEKRFERLRREAAALEERYPQPLRRPPLFGLPVGVKDIFHVDGFVTRAGSKLPVAALQGREAGSVKLLKEAGALIMGKTVTTEFAYFGPGPTRNPNKLAHTPGGSSSGSAAAVAAGFCPVATGTQTIGSIIRPAAYCGVVGYKPSYDRISRSGVVPLSPSLDHVGLFATDVAGVELVAGVLCPDWQIAVHNRAPVLGIPTGPYLEKASSEALEHFSATCDRLVGAGYRLRSVDAMQDYEEIFARHQLIVSAEAAQIHAQWYEDYSELYHPKTSELILRGSEISVTALVEALEGRQQLRRELTALMDEYELDLWIAPAAPGPAPEGIGYTGDPVMNLPWTHAGLPAVALPAGKNNFGLPMGVQVMGRWYADEAMLEWAAVLEPAVREET